MATQELLGNPWSMGTRNCRQPLQWPIRSIMQIRLKIRMNTDAIFRNCQQQRQRFTLLPGLGSRDAVSHFGSRTSLVIQKLRLRSVQQISKCCTETRSNINSLNTLSKGKKKEKKIDTNYFSKLVIQILGQGPCKLPDVLAFRPEPGPFDYS